MPVYEYRCGRCGEVFEQRRAADEADGASCPSGHTDVKRLLSVFAANRGAAQPGGGCCGGACGCH